MPNRNIIRRQRRQVCLGDLDRRIKIHNRSIQAPIFSESDFTEQFDPTANRWALIRTVTGKTIFDGVNQQDIALTHEIFIRYDDSVTTESWIGYDGSLFDIVAIEDFEERHEFMQLLCTERGDKNLGAAQA